MCIGLAVVASADLRAKIRSGAIRCDRRGCDWDRGEHRSDCHWAWAVARVYELEREAERALQKEAVPIGSEGAAGVASAEDARAG